MEQISNKTAVASVQVLPDVDKLALFDQIIKENSRRKDFDDGFFLCDLGDIVIRHRRWLKEFPRVHPHYAIKCNLDHIMLKTFVALDTGFDCASKAEIRQMLTLGAKPHQIIYANPCKQSSHICYARDNDVKLMVFDNEEELVKIKKDFPGANLVLRIVTDDSTSMLRLSSKFGAQIVACRSLIETAHEMGLQMAGICFHVGSCCQDANAYVKALENSRSLFDYSESIGYHFTLLDIGGGFPGTENVKLKFEEIAVVVNEQLDKLFPMSEFPDLRVIAEPGRYYAASAFTLATNVIAKKKVTKDMREDMNDIEQSGDILDTIPCTEAEDTAFMYYINDGLYGSFNCLIHDHAELDPTPLKPCTSIIKYSSTIWGPSCDGNDKVVENIFLPELNNLDWIVWSNMGAYTISASCSFNGFKVMKIYYVISEENWAHLRDMTGETSIDAVIFSEQNVDTRNAAAVLQLQEGMVSKGFAVNKLVSKMKRNKN